MHWTHSVAFNSASRNAVTWERKCIQERRNTQSGLSQKHVFPMNSPNCSHVSGGQAYRIIYSALDRLVILITVPSRKAGWQVGVTSVIFGSLEKVVHAFFCLTCGNGLAVNTRSGLCTPLLYKQCLWSYGWTPLAPTIGLRPLSCAQLECTSINVDPQAMQMCKHSRAVHLD